MKKVLIALILAVLVISCIMAPLSLQLWILSLVLDKLFYSHPSIDDIQLTTDRLLVVANLTAPG